MTTEDSELGAPVDEQAQKLALLARQSLQGEAPHRDTASFLKVGGKLAERRRKRRLRGASAGAALALVVTLALFFGHGRALTYRVVNGAVVEGSRIVAGSGTLVRFSDGSELALAAGAETHIAVLDARGGQVHLDEGTAEVKIAKRPNAAWTLAAGPYSVHVTGTAFSLAWSSREQSFAISMQSGSVVVSGPLVGAGMTLHAGQRLQSSIVTGQLVVRDATVGASEQAAAAAPPTNAAAVPAVNAGAEPVAGAPRVEPSPQTSAPAAPTVTAVPSGAEASAPRAAAAEWREKAAKGAFADVIDAAERRGLDATIRSAPLDDLSALADSARYARRSELARRVLLAERARFPKSSAAREAAFFLGRIAEDEGGGAAEWYDRYLAESPHGSYASQALGRKMMLAYQERGAAAAKPLARAYLERYPRGAYARSAATIADETPVPSP